MPQELFEINTIASRKRPTNTTEDKQQKIIGKKFYHKELLEVI